MGSAKVCLGVGLLTTKINSVTKKRQFKLKPVSEDNIKRVMNEIKTRLRL